MPASFYAIPTLVIDDDGDDELRALIDCAKEGRALELPSAGPICDFTAKPEIVRRWSCAHTRPMTPARFL